MDERRPSLLAGGGAPPLPSYGRGGLQCRHRHHHLPLRRPVLPRRGERRHFLLAGERPLSLPIVRVIVCLSLPIIIKKAREISVLCDAEVALIVFSTKAKLYQYSSQARARLMK